jgi:hypothetical protein
MADTTALMMVSMNGLEGVFKLIAHSLRYNFS